MLLTQSAALAPQARANCAGPAPHAAVGFAVLPMPPAAKGRPAQKTCADPGLPAAMGFVALPIRTAAKARPDTVSYATRQMSAVVVSACSRALVVLTSVLQV